MKKSLFVFLYFMSCWALRAQNSPIILDNTTSNPLPSTIYHCGAGQLNMKVNASASAATSDYKITQITKTPDTFNTPVPFTRNVTDIFSNSIPIPFANGFTFFGKKYTKFAVGTNGRLVFTNDKVGGVDLIDLLNTAAYKDDYLSNIASKLASLDFNKISTSGSNASNIASIFGGWTYLAQNVTGSLPRRVYFKSDASKIIVLFDDVSQQGSSTTKNNVLFYLYPDDKFDIVITRKGLSTVPQAQNAIVGIQNEDATKAQWPLKNDIDYYNNGTWSIDATGPKTYHFEPVTEPLVPQISWQVNNVSVSNTNPYSLDLSTITTNNATLRAVINYVKASDPSQVVSTETSNEITLKKIPSNLALLPAVNNCNISAALAIDPSSIPSSDYGAFDFQWYIDNTIISGATLPTLTTTTSGSHVYKVVATSKYFPSCSVFADQTVALVSSLPTFADKVNIGLCDTNGATSTSVNLDSPQYFPSGPGNGTLYQVTYLNNNGAQLPSSTIVINNGTTVSGKVKVEPLPLGSCTAVTYNYSFTYTSLPQPTTYNLGPFCSGINAYLLSDFEAQFAGKGYTFKYKRPSDAGFGVLTSVDPTANPDIEVQISAPSVSCTTISNIHFNINPPVTATPATTILADICSTQTAGFNLTVLDSEINGTPGVVITYSDSFGVIANPSSYIPRDASGNVKTGATTIYAIVTQTTGSLTCQSQQIVATTVNVYQKPTLKITSPIVMAQCAGSTTYNLVIPNANWGTLVDNPSLIDHIEYYAPGSAVPMSAAQAGAYNFSQGANPTMKIVYKNSSCDDTVGFNLIQNPLPAPKSTPIYFCGETSKTLGQIKSDIIANPQNYIFKYGGTTLTDSYVFQTNTDYNLTIEDATTHCPVSYTLHFTLGSGIAVLPSYQYPQVCDSDFDGKTQIDLTKVQPTITTDANASFKYYSGGVLISTPTTYMTKGVNDVVDVVVSSSTPGLCPSNTQIIVKVDLPIQPQGLQANYNICYKENFAVDITNDTDYDSIDWVDSKGSVIATGAQLYIPFNTNIYGNYSVIVKTKGAQCPYIVNFSITDTNQPKITKVNTNNNQIEVIATGGKTPYTYYYNGVPSSSNIFLNPTEPKYTIQVQGQDGCMGPFVDVYFISLNNYITPNGDGINDYWEVKNLDKMQNVQMVISDRMGNVVFQSNNVNNLRWDGKQNGRPLPTASYWYVIKWQDPATQEVITRTGWILLKNRN